MDVTQFLQTFLEETSELLAEAEEILLKLQVQSMDPDSINGLFRCIHTIKGTSVLFDFKEINELAKILENFLDQIRQNNISITQKDVDSFLETIDCLRNMLTSIASKEHIDTALAESLIAFFKNRVQEIPSDRASAPQVSTPNDEVFSSDRIESIETWSILFSPAKESFSQKQAFVSIFSALAEMGILEIEVDTSELPDFAQLNPQECYLRWKLKLTAQTSREALEGIFSWVVNPEEVQIDVFIPEKRQGEESSQNLPDKNTKIKRETSSSVRVSTEKIDSIINSIGELIITQSTLNQISLDFDMSRLEKLQETLTDLKQNSRELQASIMRIRMVPMENVFSIFPRMIYDIAQKNGKQIELGISGEQTEIDKNMIEKITDPLVHLIRNALDHGIESKEERIKAGKPPLGNIQLSAYQEGSNVIIEVTDDGAGINHEKIRDKALKIGLIKADEILDEEQIQQFIFHPGFSTSSDITELSGRGVGLDVVYKNVHDLGGTIELVSEIGKGTTFSLSFPLTLVIMDCQLVKIGNQTCIIPMIEISEILQIDLQAVNQIDQENILYRLREHYIPILFPGNILSTTENSYSLENRFLIITAINEQLYGLVVDELLSQQQIVIKSLEDNYQKIQGVSGITILGDGQIAIIMDVNSLINIFESRKLPDKKLNVNPGIQNGFILEIMESPLENQHLQFLSFMLAGQEYGIDIMAVREIRMWEEGNQLPNVPVYIRGVINVRGNIVPVIDLSSRFNLKKEGPNEYSAIIILNVKRDNKYRWIGIAVDEVSDTHTILRSQIDYGADSRHAVLEEYVSGLVTLDNRMIILLNTKDFISELLGPVINQGIYPEMNESP